MPTSLSDSSQRRRASSRLRSCSHSSVFVGAPPMRRFGPKNSSPWDSGPVAARSAGSAALSGVPVTPIRARRPITGLPADARPFPCHLPLGHEHGISPVPLAEQASQDRGGQVEGDVADDDGVDERMPQGVGVTDGDAWQGPRETACPVLVDVDGGDPSTGGCEPPCQGAVAGADLEDGALRPADEGVDPVDRRRVGEEVLAELMAAAVERTRHGRAPMKRGAPGAGRGEVERARASVRVQEDSEETARCDGSGAPSGAAVADQCGERHHGRHDHRSHASTVAEGVTRERRR